MYFFVCTFVLGLAVYADAISVRELTSYNYHFKFGIPLAVKIKNEEEILVKVEPIVQRIVGGSVTDITEAPYQVGVLCEIFFVHISVCGGSLISNNRVLTAAHCQWDGFFTATSMTTVLGSNTIFSGGVRCKTTDVVMHPDWNPDTAANDLAIIRIPNVDFTSVIQPIALPNLEDASKNFSSQIAFASGFGATADCAIIAPNQTMHCVSLQIITNAQCSDIYGDFVHDTNICTSGAGGKSTCSGDSGGPLVLTTDNRKILIGATSFGSLDGCSIGYPSAFTRISSYLSWVLSI